MPRPANLRPVTWVGEVARRDTVKVDIVEVCAKTYEEALAKLRSGKWGKVRYVEERPTGKNYVVEDLRKD
jgi:hypothetical protein